MASINIHASQDDNEDQNERELNDALNQNADLQDKLNKSEREAKELEKQLREVPRFRSPSRPKRAPSEVEPSEVILPQNIKDSLNTPPSNSLIMTDEKLEARIENMFRTLSSKSFKERNVTQDPFFDKLFDKATKAVTDEEVIALVKEEQDKQQSSILAYQTNLENQLNLLRAEVNTRLENLQGEEETDEDRVDRYKMFQESLTTIQESVTNFVSEATDTLNKRSFDVASQGKQQGDVDREIKEIDKQIRESIKKEKEASKIINEFDKAFERYANERKKEAAANFAYNEALRAKNSIGATQASVNKAYQSAKDSFMRNTPDAKAELDDEAKLGLFASQGGNLKNFDFSTVPVSFSSRKSGGGGGSQPPKGGSSSPASNNNPNVPPTVNSPVMTFGDLTQIMRELAEVIRDMAKFITTDLLDLGVKSTSKQGATAGDFANYLGKGARGVTDVTAQGTGAAVGAFFGPAGALLGREIGKMIADALPIEEFAASVGLLEEMARNTAERATPFSADLIAVKLDKQLALLEQDMRMGNINGQTLSDIQRSSNEVQLELKRAFDNVVVAIAPLIIGILESIKVLVALLTPFVAFILGYLFSIAPGTMGGAMMVGNAVMKRNQAQRRNNRAGNQAQQLDDNVPFL